MTGDIPHVANSFLLASAMDGCGSVCQPADELTAEHQVESKHGHYVQSCGVMRTTISRTIELHSRDEIQQSRIVNVDCNLKRQSLEIDRPA